MRLARLSLVTVLIGALTVGSPAQASVVEAVGVGTFEHDAPAIAWTGPWYEVKSSKDSAGSARRLDADGAAVVRIAGGSLTVSTRTNSYSGIAVIYVDGVEKKRVDLYSRSEAFQVPTIQLRDLGAGEHLIRVERANDRNPLSTGRNLILDRWVVGGYDEHGGAVPAATGGVWEHDSAAFAQTDRAWKEQASGYDSGGSSIVSNGPGSTVEFGFYGTSATLIARKDRYFGIASVSIDGSAAASVDLFAASRLNQQEVWSSGPLTDGLHWIKVSYSGKKNGQSSGTEVNLDAIRTSDAQSPASPRSLSVKTATTSTDMSWVAPADPDVMSFTIFRAYKQSGYQKIDSVSAGTRAWRDIGLQDGEWYSYRVVATDTSGNDSAPSGAAAAKAPSAPWVSTDTGLTCPSPSREVSTKAALDDAIAKAQPGDVIKLRSGQYGANLIVSVNGTASKPIWICADEGVIFDGRDTSAGTGIQVIDASYAFLVGPTVTRVKKGITVENSRNVTVSNATVSVIGEEAVHVKARSRDVSIVNNLIQDTGKINAQYGEGVYIGSDPTNWCNVTACSPDLTERTLVAGNRIQRTTAEPIEAKPGSTQGWIQDNELDGDLVDTRYAFSLVSVAGNDYLVRRNSGSGVPKDAYKSIVVKNVEGWGLRNTFSANDADLSGASGYAVWVQSGSSALVGCDNTFSGGAGRSNARCQK